MESAEQATPSRHEVQFLVVVVEQNLHLSCESPASATTAMYSCVRGHVVRKYRNLISRTRATSCL